MSLDPPQGQSEGTVKIDLPEYLGYALTQLSFEDIPEEPRSSWFLTEAVEPETKTGHWFVTQTVFTKNGLQVYWYDLEALQKLVEMAAKAGMALQQKLATIGGLVVANESQMKQTVEGLEATKRNLLHMPGN